MVLSNSDERIQKVVFIRHGIARHNLPDPSTGRPCDLRDPRLLDPPLVYQGKQQALYAGYRLKEWWRATQPGDNVKLVITSTSTLAFLPGDGYTSSEQPHEPSFFCTDLCREAFGMHYPDRRRKRSLLMKYWPILQMDPAMMEADESWRSDTRETLVDLGIRISLFLNLLASRPESSIGVVTHGVWLEECFRLHCPAVLDHGRKRVHNCDTFVLECVSREREFLRLQNPLQIT